MHGKIGFRDLARVASAEWKDATPETKAEFEVLAQQDELRYQRELVEYKQARDRQEKKRRSETPLPAVVSCTFQEAMLTNKGFVPAAAARPCMANVTFPPFRLDTLEASIIQARRLFSTSSPSSPSLLATFRAPTIAELASQLDQDSQEVFIRAMLH